MIFEDAHWTEPTSLEVLGRTRTLGVLVVIYRPEFHPPGLADPLSRHSVSIPFPRKS
jgi:hypothetical protein